MDCKTTQEIIGSYEKGVLSLKDEDEFINHIESCQDCREEFEIYYIIKYGLEEEPANNCSKEYSNFLKVYDFKGLVEYQINKSKLLIKKKRKQNEFFLLCRIVSNLSLIIILMLYFIIFFY